MFDEQEENENPRARAISDLLKSAIQRAFREYSSMGEPPILEQGFLHRIELTLDQIQNTLNSIDAKLGNK